MAPLIIGYALSVLVTLAIALFVIAFERRRAREIETDPQRVFARDDRSRNGNVRILP